MVDRLTSSTRTLSATLVAVPCALCGLPVAHYDPRIAGSKVGGLCTRGSCRSDPKDGLRRQVYTFVVVPVVASPERRP